MRLQDFLNLPPEHTISYEEARKLHEDIALKGSAGLSKAQSDRLREYLEVCLLHQAVEPELVEKMEAVCGDLRNDNGEA